MAGRRILLMHVTISSGHHHASRAIAQALSRLDASVHAINVDAFDYTSRVVRSAIMRSYMSLIRHHPDVWEYLYDNPVIHTRVRHLRKLLHHYHTRKLRQLLETVQPHAIACTQAFPCGMVADFKQHHNLHVPLVAVLTDYAPHIYWLHETVDVYVVPAEELKQRYLSHGVPEERIRVYGIPVTPRFLDPVDRDGVFRAFGLDPDVPVILIMGGGGGFGPLQELMRSVDRMPERCQFVILAGTNRALLNWVREHPFRHRVVALGYVESVAALMSIACAIITKPGGLTTAEALAKAVPLFMSSPIPGQEVCNAKYLLAHQAAIQLGTPETVGATVSEFLRHPDRLGQLRANIAAIARPRSAFETARLLLELSNQACSAFP
ncbi:MAG TPA: hypothetical protein DDX89_05960 [Candidatus Omnitrophica bacterium]|nr:MAG: hypothetical protein A2Z92_05940 [Omnitrophica WOR_2 bacterium GWA2_63_20]OGX16354.1 MAG: hypothetical protein A2105_05425 [Omnitrophica WOR_2 bacterium GWF2_63_9]OGX31166.1 MAG: hypothetical protein A3E56_04055 [Omnitrophica WOR_2 bacterium RIFCSPHIGHO2_12_FULL_64_13]OGX36657.1 MAG: hypothetical protein A3B73_02695 [Omnitrophica WOR_2 bacterium RIFCSPHIGHO2_02_FULL_63_39]OGX45041.1 MAG: hypothetical protein A3I71_04000 [Omnitrophica WOR_2 bacterium RIFCSPLOWO2_02_FULL_63_16]OGX50009.1